MALDFYGKAAGGYYEKLVTADYIADGREEWRRQFREAEEKFRDDAERYAIAEGVPKAYAGNVVRYAWEDGHSSGYFEVANCLCNLIQIFRKARKAKK